MKTSGLKYYLVITLAVTGSYNFAVAGWTPEVRISEPGTCWYPQIAVQGDTIHVVYTNVVGGDKISYVRSVDGGETWSDHVVLSDTSNTDDAYFPRILLFQSKIIVLWQNTFSEGLRDRNIGYSISYDNGNNWIGPNYILYPNWEHILYFTAAGSDSIINIIFNSRIEHELRYYNVRSQNFGQSWSDTLELFRSWESGLMDMAAYNNIFHYVWYGNFEELDDWETYYLRSDNGGLNWFDNVPLVDIDDYSSRWPSLSINDSGNILFCWTDFKYSPYWFTGDLFIKLSYDNGESWSNETQITVDHLAKRSHVFWNSDTIHVVWERSGDNGDDIYYIRSSDGGMNWENEQRLDHDPADSYWPRVASSNGKVYVIWADSRNDPNNDIYRGIYFSCYEEDVGINQEISRPKAFNSLIAYPNPFNSTTIINYSNIEGGDIEIYDICGRLIRKLGCGGSQEGKITWDATNAFGEKVSSGIYFAIAKSSQGVQTAKLVYLK